MIASRRMTSPVLSGWGSCLVLISLASPGDLEAEERCCLLSDLAHYQMDYPNSVRTTSLLSTYPT
ncbi:hypothetical protein BDV06DRAFT_186232 [Aspergillus oleicola]